MTVRPTPQELIEVQKYFGLPSVQLVEKDWDVAQAMQVILATEATPFRPVFAGGTRLPRAHRLVEHM